MIFDDTPEIPENLISLNEISLSENDFDDTPVIPENLISFEDIVPPDETNTLDDLKIMREKFIQNPLIGYLNINSLRGDKFLQLKDILLRTPIDIFCVDETKLTYDFTDALFQIDGYQFPPLRRDRDAINSFSYGGGN